MRSMSHTEFGISNFSIFVLVFLNDLLSSLAYRKIEGGIKISGSYFLLFKQFYCLLSDHCASIPKTSKLI